MLLDHMISGVEAVLQDWAQSHARGVDISLTGATMNPVISLKVHLALKMKREMYGTIPSPTQYGTVGGGVCNARVVRGGVTSTNASVSVGMGTGDHPEISASMYWLAIVCQLRGDSSAALHHLGETLALQYRIYGADSKHPDIVKTIAATAETHAGRNEFDEAKVVCAHALRLAMEMPGTEAETMKLHPKVQQLHALQERITHGLSTTPKATLNRRPWHRLITANFIGREQELDQLYTTMNETEHDLTTACPGRGVIVSEMAGQGKTELMLRYCYDHRHTYVHGVYWVDATTVAAMHRSVVAILTTLGVEHAATSQLRNHDQSANALFAWCSVLTMDYVVLEVVRLGLLAAVHGARG
jgi:hypothetical protein